MSDSHTSRHVGPKPRACGCKGIRSCRLCEVASETPRERRCSDHSGDSADQSPTKEVRTTVSIFNYCQLCKKAWQLQHSSDPCNENGKSERSFVASAQIHSSDTQPSSSPDIESGDNCIGKHLYEVQGKCAKLVDDSAVKLVDSSAVKLVDSSAVKLVDSSAVKLYCSHVNSSQLMTEFEGIMIVEDFVTGEEEELLNSAISKSSFVNSQSGRRKQDYGPKVNFKKQKLKAHNFKGLPSYSQFLYERMKAHPHLGDFEPVELCNLEYCQTRGSHIDPHFDDSWLWGERLVTVNLLSDSTLTFTLDSDPGIAVRVPLQRRSLIVVSSAARHKWKHSIQPSDVEERRLAMTFRELSEEFSTGGRRQHEGADLLRLALTFEGCAVSG